MLPFWPYFCVFSLLLSIALADVKIARSASHSPTLKPLKPSSRRPTTHLVSSPVRPHGSVISTVAPQGTLVSTESSVTLTTSTTSTSAHPITLSPYASNHEYLLFAGDLAASHQDAVEQCESLHGSLLSVDIKNIAHFANQLASFAYVDSWNGDKYLPDCIGLMPGNPIVVPLNNCTGPYDFICDIPLLT